MTSEKALEIMAEMDRVKKKLYQSKSFSERKYLREIVFESLREQLRYEAPEMVQDLEN